MAEAKFSIAAEKRKKTGKEFSEKLREESKIPAVIYGPEIEENILISINYQEFEKLFRNSGKHHVVEISVGKDKYQCVVKDYKIHPISRFFLHIDFLAVTKTKPFVTEIPLKYVGTPVGVKEGGTMFIFKKKVKVRTLLADLPEKIDVDITKLGRKQYLIVRDIVHSDKLQILTHEGDVLLEVK